MFIFPVKTFTNSPPCQEASKISMETSNFLCRISWSTWSCEVMDFCSSVDIIGSRFVFHYLKTFDNVATSIWAVIFVDCSIIPSALLLIQVYDTSIPTYDHIPDHWVTEIWKACFPFMKWEWTLSGNASMLQWYYNPPLHNSHDLLQRKVVSFFKSFWPFYLVSFSFSSSE